MALTIIQGDITKLKTDAIVNAANSRLAPGGGVCGAIFAAAGYEKLDRACREIGGCETGGAVMTPGFDLPAKYVIHAVGPIWYGGNQNEEKLLESCYQSALELAFAQGCSSVAFPVISAGIYGYPKRDALTIAVQTIRCFLRSKQMDVCLIVFDREMSALASEVLENELNKEETV